MELSLCKPLETFELLFRCNISNHTSFFIYTDPLRKKDRLFCEKLIQWLVGLQESKLELSLYVEEHFPSACEQ